MGAAAAKVLKEEAPCRLHCTGRGRRGWAAVRVRVAQYRRGGGELCGGGTELRRRRQRLRRIIEVDAAREGWKLSLSVEFDGLVVAGNYFGGGASSASLPVNVEEGGHCGRRDDAHRADEIAFP